MTVAYYNNTVKKGRNKARKVMSEFKHGTLRSSSGDKVAARDQAVAIAMSEAGMAKKKKKKGY